MGVIRTQENFDHIVSEIIEAARGEYGMFSCLLCNEQLTFPVIYWHGNWGVDILLHEQCCQELVFKLMRDVFECMGGIPRQTGWKGGDVVSRSEIELIKLRKRIKEQQEYEPDF
ncbi:MAG TPA: hypothetical protein VKR06_46025 [Ktedonosporobacter sp.]|nr:hypothetical protein [Ktedonosporobacter sp.]